MSQSNVPPLVASAGALTTPGRSPTKKHKKLQFEFTPPDWENEKQHVDERDHLMTAIYGGQDPPDNEFYKAYSARGDKIFTRSVITRGFETYYEDVVRAEYLAQKELIDRGLFRVKFHNKEIYKLMDPIIMALQNKFTWFQLGTAPPSFRNAAILGFLRDMASRLKTEDTRLQKEGVQLTKVPALDKEFHDRPADYPKLQGKVQYPLSASWICFQVNLENYTGYVSIFLRDFISRVGSTLNLDTVDVKELRRSLVSALDLDLDAFTNHDDDVRWMIDVEFGAGISKSTFVLGFGTSKQQIEDVERTIQSAISSNYPDDDRQICGFFITPPPNLHRMTENRVHRRLVEIRNAGLPTDEPLPELENLEDNPFVDEDMNVEPETPSQKKRVAEADGTAGPGRRDVNEDEDVELEISSQKKSVIYAVGTAGLGGNDVGRKKRTPSEKPRSLSKQKAKKHVTVPSSDRFLRSSDAANSDVANKNI